MFLWSFSVHKSNPQQQSVAPHYGAQRRSLCACTSSLSLLVYKNTTLNELLRFLCRIQVSLSLGLHAVKPYTMSSRSRPKGLPDTSNYRRISPEEANDQNNRLTNKHIRTLMLLDETLKENQELRRLLEMLHNEKCTCCRTDDSEQRVYAATQPLRSQVQSLTAELTAKNERLTAAERQLVEIQQTLEGQLAQSEKIHSEKVRVSLYFSSRNV